MVERNGCQLPLEAQFLAPAFPWISVPLIKEVNFLAVFFFSFANAFLNMNLNALVLNTDFIVMEKDN